VPSNILIVDDEERIRFAVRRFPSALHDYDVVEAEPSAPRRSGVRYCPIPTSVVLD